MSNLPLDGGRSTRDTDHSAFARELSLTCVHNRFADKAYQRLQLSWSQLSEIIEHDPCDDYIDKGLLSGFVPMALPCAGAECKHDHGKDRDGVKRAPPISGLYRSNAHATKLDLVVLDCEAPDDDTGCKRGVPTEAVNELFALLSGTAFLAYTTITCPPPDEHRFRLILLPSRPIELNERAEVWCAVVWALGSQYIDRACKDASRYYTWPYARFSDTHHWSCRGYGEPLDVDDLLTEYRAACPKDIRKAEIGIAAGKSVDVQSALAALPSLNDGRWTAVRTLAFELGKWGAWHSLREADTLAIGLPMFRAALGRCELSAANPFDKCMATARACISNGWRRRRSELDLDAARLQSAVTRGKQGSK